jgi:hypothetical protein
VKSAAAKNAFRNSEMSHTEDDELVAG